MLNFFAVRIPMMKISSHDLFGKSSVAVTFLKMFLEAVEAEKAGAEAEAKKGR